MAEVLRFVGYVAAIVVFAWLARRMLGADRVSLVRALLSGVAGVVVGAGAGLLLQQLEVNDDGSALGTAIVVALLVTMGSVVALQLLSKPRSTRPRRIGPANSWRAARRTREVAGICVRHGLGTFLGRGGTERPPSGAQIRSALEESGVVFVKFGQLLASRPDLIGPAAADELGALRHNVTPLTRGEMEPVVRAAIPDLDQLFSSVEWQPIGSASIAQVYAATLTDGEEVVIKVRRPGADEEVRRDGLVVRNLATLAERHSTWARSVGLADLAESFVADLEGELDYQREAAAARDLAISLFDGGIGIPHVHSELTSGDVIVMRRVEGQTLADAELSSLSPAVREALAAKLVSTHMSAMLDGGRFHADPHPGNVMLTPNRELFLIDLGATGVLSPVEQSALSSLLMGVKLREPTMLRDSLLLVSEAQAPVDTARLDRSLGHLLNEHLRPDEDMGPQAVVELLRIMRDQQLQLPPSSSPMFRSLVTVLDSLETLAPGFAALNAVEEAGNVPTPVPSNTQDFADLARDETLKLLPLLRRAPRLTDSVATQLERGDLSIRVRALSHPEEIVLISSLVNRAVLAFIAVGLGVVSAMLFGLDKGPFLTNNLSVYDVLASVGLLAGAVLIMRVVLEALDAEIPPIP